MRTLITALTLLATLGTAHAAPSPFPFELSVSPQAHVASSDSLTGLSDVSTHLSAAGRFSYALDEHLDLFVGYRRLEQLHLYGADAVDWRTDHYAILLGARVRVPLVGTWLKLYGQLDLEADYADLRIDLGGDRVGRQSTWSAGVVPELGLEAEIAIDDAVAFVFRFGAGYALRLDHDFDAVTFATDAPAERSLDLGPANFSGLMVGTTMAIRF